ncbi:hypothetical protein E2C01_021016 [Portunus trituberculatus]|uniref:Uncharacterized protein n=1 Tax=Portunus trituberculatus TaxID=210409 RepID=A0A5B7E1D6_PORTR|nr:hypothetical protein [Portunus trituberculatus]
MTKFQDRSWSDLNPRMDVCQIPRLPPYPLYHLLPKCSMSVCMPAYMHVCM